MYELDGTQFEKGIFELRLTKDVSRLKRWIVMLGPVGGRLVALSLFLVSAFLTLKHQPAVYILERGWATGTVQAVKYQNAFIWALMGVGLIVYFSVLLFSQESVILTFDRAQGVLRYSIIGGRFRATKQGIVPFKNIEVFKVHGPAAEPKSEHGYIEIRGRALESAPTSKPLDIKFRLLSDDQLKIYPLNLSKMMDRMPTGDWVDPEASPV